MAEQFSMEDTTNIEDNNLKLYLELEDFNREIGRYYNHMNADNDENSALQLPVVHDMSEDEREERLDLIQEYLEEEGFMGDTEENEKLIHCHLSPSHLSTPPKSDDDSGQGSSNVVGHTIAELGDYVSEDEEMDFNGIDDLVDLLSPLTLGHAETVNNQIYGRIDLTDVFNCEDNFDPPAVEATVSSVQCSFKPDSPSYGSPPVLTLHATPEGISGTPEGISRPPTILKRANRRFSSAISVLKSKATDQLDDQAPGNRPSSPYTIRKWFADQNEERPAKKRGRKPKRNKNAETSLCATPRKLKALNDGSIGLRKKKINFNQLPSPFSPYRYRLRSRRNSQKENEQ